MSPLHSSVDPSPTEAEILISTEDMLRLRALVERSLDGPRAAASAAELLELELERATVRPRAELPADVVAMGSRVLFEHVETGKQREVVLVYPEDADSARSRISVLTPVGLAILGLSRGASIRWPMPNERTGTFRVIAVNAPGES